MICCPVRTSSGRNRRAPNSSLEDLIIFETSFGSAFLPLCSPISNCCFKNSFCFCVKRDFFVIVLSAHPIVRGEKHWLFCSSHYNCTVEILVPSSISFEAYPRFALSYSVSCSGSRLCFPVSRCACNDTKRLYALMHPSSGQGKSGEACSFSPSSSSCSRLLASLAAFGSLADFLFTCLSHLLERWLSTQFLRWGINHFKSFRDLQNSFKLRPR